MINHARTLLLNSRRMQSSDLPGQQYVPEEFVPLVLPLPLATIRRTLFGNAPDAYKQNYRMHEFMTLLHATELADFLYAFDPRVTYLPLGDALFQLVEGVTSRTVVGTTDLILGGYTLLEDDGVLYYAWDVTATDGSTLTITQVAPKLRLFTADLTFVDGLSLPYTLPGTSVTLQVAPPTPGDTWRLVGTARPAYDLAAITQQVQLLPQEILTWLFQDTGDPAVTQFQNFWIQTPTPCKLAGFLCAVIWQMELLRRRSD